ncbi:MAG: hypothetical protein GC151_03735 [Betaproteobacteria bacterium]|nr:hypothetical protein [Betaproteobacteria bacterium]
MTFRKCFKSLLGAFLILAACAAFARDDNFITDQNGCRIYNPVPRPEETVTWSGGCKDGFAEGKGVLQFFLSGIADESYEGEMKGGYADGHGTQMMVDGGRYEGEWSHSKQNGQGTYYAADGSIYEGAWKNGKPDGFGTLRTPEGRVLRGQWVDGQFQREIEDDPNRT